MKEPDSDIIKIANIKFIQHFGIISKINKNNITVSLMGHINCETCKVKSSCGISGSGKKEIKIQNSLHSYQLNEKVKVIMRKELGLMAVFLAFVFPFLLLFVTLITALFFFNEWIAGLLAMLILIPYYIVIYSLKNSFENYFKISIVKNS